MPVGDFTFSEHMGELIDVDRMLCKKAFHGVFRRSMKIAAPSICKMDGHYINVRGNRSCRTEQGGIDFEDASF